MPLEAALYLALLFTTTVLSLLRWPLLDRADRILVYLLCSAFLYESVSYALLYGYGKNAFLSHFYSPLEFLLITTYYRRSLKVFRGGLFAAIAVLGIAGSALNTIFWQPLTALNSHFLLFESTAVIIYSLMAFYQIMTAEDTAPHRSVLFWSSTCFIIFWGATFMGWGLFSYVEAQRGLLSALRYNILAVAVYLLYLGLGLVFLRYRSLIPSGQHAR